MSLTPSNAGSSQQFDLVLDADESRLRAYLLRLDDGQYVAWSPYFFRVLRREYRLRRSHLELTDDVISTLYDPRDQVQVSAIYSLANLSHHGLFQLYGGRAISHSATEAVRLAERGSARLISALKGRFRKSVITQLSVEEATAYYQHLLGCQWTAATLGLPVRRLTGAGISGSGALGQVIAADAEEQLEVIVAGLEDVPFAIQTILEPYLAQDITRILKLTADELSRFASMVHGSDSVNLSIAPGTLVSPVHAVLRQNVRSTGISNVERRQSLESSARSLEASRSQGRTEWGREATSREEFQGHTATRYAAGARITEEIGEHVVEETQLERTYSDRYNLSKSFSGAGVETVRTQGQQSAQQTGTRQQESETHSQAREEGTMTTDEIVNTAITGNRGASGNRSGAGSRSGVESYSVGGQVTTVEDRTFESDLHQASARTFEGETQQGGRTQTWDQGVTATSGERGQSYDNTFDRQHEGVSDVTRATETRGGGVNTGAIPVVSAENTMHVERGGAIEQSRDYGGETGTRQSDFTGREETYRSGTEHTNRQETTAGSGSENVVQNVEGTQRVTNVATTSGGGTRSSHESYGYNEAYSYQEGYYDNSQMARRSERGWESEVDGVVRQQSDSDWQQATQDRTQGVVTTMRAYGGSYSESGVRSGHLSQQDHVVTDRQIDRVTDRQETGWRDEHREGTLDRYATEEGRMEMEQQRLAETDAYQRVQSEGVSGETGNFAGHSETFTRGYAGPTGSSMFIGIGQNRQTLDAWRETLANLLTQQRERLVAGRDEGFFHNQTVLMAPDELTLERLIGAVLATWREENVVVPLSVRYGDAALRRAAMQFCLDERREDNPMHPYAWRQGMTANEVAAMVHPVRIDGKGGTSTSSVGWPDLLSMDRGAGELELGYQISPATDAVTDLVLRVPLKDLMHMLIVGASGSGKSNSALHIVAQVINRLRENERGRRLPLPMTGGIHVNGPEEGRPAVGVTVLDPTGEWRRLAHLLLSTEFRFYSLTPGPFHVPFNPVAIPSPFITPTEWVAAFAKRWAMAYATGSTGVSLIRKALTRLYEAHEVFEYPERSQSLSLTDLHAHAKTLHEELLRSREDNISAGVLKRILDKMEEFLPGGISHEAFGRPATTDLEGYLWPYGATVIEGSFGEDEMLKAFIIGLLGTAIYYHVEGRYQDTISREGSLDVRTHLLVFEEAHVVMQGDDQKSQLDAVLEKAAGVWDNFADRGRKYGLFTITLAQHWRGLPEGVVGSARIVIAQGINTVNDAEAAAAALGFRPGRSSMDEMSPIIEKLLDMPVGCGIFKRKRLPKSRETEQAAVGVNFPDISKIEPPTDGQLQYLLEHAGANADLQREMWRELQTAFAGQVEHLIP